MIKKLTTFAAALMFIVAAAPASADDDDDNGNEIVLTVLAEGLIVEQSLPDANCVFTNTVNGIAGRDLNIGEITIDSTEVVELGPFPACLAFGGAEFADVVAEFVITAANSDQIYGVWQTVILIDPTGGVRPLGRYQITGGTGRFEGAKGKGVISAQGRFGDPAVRARLIGDTASDDDD
ncbi:MAG: hypothetical protein MJA83_20440 [Gammaproteobacteria bacterium]|nr:hypothetical protein [Gammaproteobacteria bacterium]